MNDSRETYLESLPPFYEGVLEVEIIADAFGYSQEALRYEVRRIHNNQFIMRSDSIGLQEKEELYGIIASPTETLEFRRKRLIDRKSRMPPFTWLWLLERLDIILDGEYIASRDVGQRTLTIFILLTQAEHHEFIRAYVLDVIPSNMVVNVVLKYNTHADLATVSHEFLGEITHRKIPITPL
ncbi:MAG: YmfQ family protein [Symbiobacteriaceae bacterium]|nr:YmfQ family protein [Symbiobacteriaceae bacterium]